MPADAARFAEDNFGMGLFPPGVGVDARGLLPLPPRLIFGMSGDGGPTSTSGGAIPGLAPTSEAHKLCTPCTHDDQGTPDGGRQMHGRRLCFGKLPQARSA